MDAQTLTIISGIVLLIVFALVGWNIRRRNARLMLKGQRRNKNK